MPTPDRSHALDHVVVVMFENRSFDNLLGRLYQPGEVRSFEGVIGKDLSNPIPERAEHGASRGHVPYGVAPTMDTPNLPLKGLAKGMFFALLALGKELGQTVPPISPDADVTRAEGIAMMREMFGHMFPHLGDQGAPTTWRQAEAHDPHAPMHGMP
jgi:hypothetical protein